MIQHWKVELSQDVSIQTVKTGEHYKVELPPHTLPEEPGFVGSGPYENLSSSDLPVTDDFATGLFTARDSILFRL